ncbi:MAG: hypothetical protein BroJett018_34980 [Chloroflexota bacterium]|nr:MAG: hypothetical protein BroJett018_34980 [Chloroflexota bacterium]
MNKQLLEQARALALRNYTTILSSENLSDGTEMFLARNPELEGCMAQGETPEAAQSNLLEARIDYIYFLLEDGLPVPDPTREVTSSLSTEHTK